MKKVLLAMVVILAFATSSFAGVSFLTAPSVGEGNWAVLGMYANNHLGITANGDDPTALDSNSLGVRGEYGMMKDLDLLLSYSFDTLPNVKRIDPVNEDGKQTSGTTTGLGVKYSLGAQTIPLVGTVVDTAVAGGYQTSNLGVKSTMTGKVSITDTTLSVAYLISKQMDNLMPYGAIAYKSLGRSFGKSSMDNLSGTGLAFNVGCMIGIAKGQAVAIEYNTENDGYAGVSKPAKDDATGVNVSGISLGYVYVF